MAKLTQFLKLNIYDVMEDAFLPNKDIVSGVFGYTNSNMTKIDDAIKNIDENIKQTITTQQIDQLFN